MRDEAMTTERSTRVLLDVFGVSKAYSGVRAVDDVSFRLEPGEVCALIGPNGAGKTTLLNLLSGHTKSDRGVVFLSGRSLSGFGPRQIWRCGVSRTFQVPAIFPSLTSMEHLELVYLSHAGRTVLASRASRSVARAAAGELLARVGLLGAQSRLAEGLTQSERKRLEIAMAVANEPKLLLLDEPGAGLTPDETRGLMQLVVHLVAGCATAVLFIEHNVTTVLAFAQRFISLREGRVVAQGPVANLGAAQRAQDTYLAN
jgi:branched-chain amino acid transport system ATP-binding protein